MKHIIKKTFVPHKVTNPRPLFWHPISVSFFALALFFISGFLALQNLEETQSDSLLGDIRSGLLIAFTNKERSDVGLTTLVESDALNQAAILKAEDMAEEGYFAHYSPTGISPWFWITKAGYTYQRAGENLAVNFDDSKKVVNAWMNSPAHKANIVKDGYTEIGIGTAQGVYKGKKATFVVQLFATPKIMPDTNALAFTIEKKVPTLTNEESSVRGAEVEILSMANIGQVLFSETYLPIIILSILSLVIVCAILTVCAKWKLHTKKFYLSLFVLCSSLLVSLYTLIDFFQEVSIRFL